jgi:hypothetical protein
MNTIYICQYYTNNVSHGPFAEKINSKYAVENNYGYYCEKENDKIIEYLKNAAPTWYKSKLILDVFEKYNPDYVLFLDTDAIISDNSIRIEEFIDLDYYFVAAEDVSTHSLMNAGVFLIKNNEWSVKFLKEWGNCRITLKPADCIHKLDVGDEDLYIEGFYSDRLWMDQTALTYLYDTKEYYKNKIKIISNRSFNWHQYNQKNFIFHAYMYGNVKNRTLDKIYNSIFNVKIDYDNNSLASLAEKYYTDKHYGHDYFNQIYQKLFIGIKKSATKIVELGVHEGQSINIWRDFFINAKIIGIDCQISRAQIDNPERIELLEYTIGYNNNKDLVHFCENNKDIDLFIDDGSHTMRDQQEVFGKVFKSIKSGGIYIIEDLHTSLSVKNDVNSIWKSDKNTTTLDLLEKYLESGKIESDYLSEDECEYLEKNIASCEIYKLKPDWSYLGIITKK